MFSWLRRWLLKVLAEPQKGIHSMDTLSSQGERTDLFSPDEILIYRHAVRHENGVWVYADKDPINLWRRLVEHSDEISINIRVARSPSKAAPQRHKELYNRLYEVFEIPPPEQGGLSEPQIAELFLHFQTYVAEKKNLLPPITTCVRAISPDSTPTDAPEASPPQPTPTTSDSGSIEPEGHTEPPTPTPSDTASQQGQSSLGWSTTRATPTETVKPLA